MNFVYKKSLLLLATSLLTSSLMSDNSSSKHDTKAQRASDSCIKKEPHTALFVSGEFLYWRPDQTGMAYALAVSSISDSFLGPKSEEIRQKSKYGPGFRVGAGIDFIKAPCSLSFFWTRFHQTTHSSNSKPIIIGTQLLSPANPITIGGSAVGAGKPHSAWKLHLDLLELDFSYRLCFNKNYLLQPYLGVIGGWINQSQRIKYDHFLDTTTLEFLNARIKQTDNFKGIGPKLGINGDFALGAGFGIMGNLGASFLYGKANNPVTINVQGDFLGFPQAKTRVAYKQNNIIPILQAQVGLTWGITCQKHFSIDLAAIYEAQYFWGTWRNQSSQIQNIYIAETGYGNLMLQGATFQLKLTF